MTRPIAKLLQQFLWLGLLACVRVRGAVGEPERCRVLMEQASPPFAIKAPDGQTGGFAVELMRLIAHDQNLQVEFDLRPWQQVYPDFVTGHGDVLGLVAYSEERARHMDFSVPFETLRCVFYIRTGSPAITSADQLVGKRIGVIKDSIVDEFARHQNWHARLVSYPTLAACLAATQSGDLDATLSMQFVTDYMIRSRGLSDLVRTEFAPEGLQYSLCYAVQPGNKRLLARINNGLVQLRQSGEYDRLYEKWLGPLEPHRLHWRDVQPYLPLLTGLAVLALGIFVWQRRLLHQLSRQAREIKQSEERLQLVFEGSQDAFWDWNVASGHVLRSPRWSGMLGYAEDEIGPNQQDFSALIHPEDQPRVLENDDRIWRDQDQFIIELRMKAKSGEWRWVLDRGKVVARDPATGEPLRVTGTHTDITGRKRAEAEADKLRQKMLETQKLESLGVLAGGIAHDFNNLLTVILGNSTLARLETGETSPNRERLDGVVTAAHRAAELCHQLLAYAGKGLHLTARINLNELVAETARLLELSISKQARLEFVLAPALPAIEADPTQIRQVIMNLVINASESLVDKPGTVRIATKVITVPLAKATDSGPPAEVAPGDYVCVEVADTGTGMTPEVLARIFDPFFTTKFTGRGLGLAAVTGIVRTHGGTLKVRSTPGQGSVFSVYLPVWQPQTRPPFAVDDSI